MDEKNRPWMEFDRAWFKRNKARTWFLRKIYTGEEEYLHHEPCDPPTGRVLVMQIRDGSRMRMPVADGIKNVMLVVRGDAVYVVDASVAPPDAEAPSRFVIRYRAQLERMADEARVAQETFQAIVDYSKDMPTREVREISESAGRGDVCDLCARPFETADVCIRGSGIDSESVVVHLRCARDDSFKKISRVTGLSVFFDGSTEGVDSLPPVEKAKYAYAMTEVLELRKNPEMLWKPPKRDAWFAPTPPDEQK